MKEEEGERLIAEKWRIREMIVDCRVTGEIGDLRRRAEITLVRNRGMRREGTTMVVVHGRF